MATDSAIKSVTNTFSTTVADTITLTQTYPAIEVTNFDAVNYVYVSMDGTSAPTTAVAEANNLTAIPPLTSKVIRSIPRQDVNPNTIVLSIVGSGGKYTVEGVQ